MPAPSAAAWAALYIDPITASCCGPSVETNVTCSLGMTSRCTGALGLMSRITKQASLLCRISLGISPLRILQNMQSELMPCRAAYRYWSSSIRTPPGALMNAIIGPPGTLTGPSISLAPRPLRRSISALMSSTLDAEVLQAPVGAGVRRPHLLGRPSPGYVHDDAVRRLAPDEPVPPDTRRVADDLEAEGLDVPANDRAGVFDLDMHMVQIVAHRHFSLTILGCFDAIRLWHPYQTVKTPRAQGQAPTASRGTGRML